MHKNSFVLTIYMYQFFTIFSCPDTYLKCYGSLTPRPTVFVISVQVSPAPLHHPSNESDSHVAADKTTWSEDKYKYLNSTPNWDA
jgi:hypothetical protein